MAEVIGGILSGSLALLSDAGHMVTTRWESDSRYGIPQMASLRFLQHKLLSQAAEPLPGSGSILSLSCLVSSPDKNLAKPFKSGRKRMDPRLNCLR